jgi:hypothetical protein
MPSLKKLSPDEADRIARLHGFDNAEDYKSGFVEENERSHYDMAKDTETKEIYLLRKPGYPGTPVPTGHKYTP